jgi:dTMP kinase
MEYDAFGIPREDLVIFLYVPFTFSQKLIEQKNHRKYLGKVKDIHESNMTLMREVEKEYLSLSKKYKHWVKIDCVKKDAILSREEIHVKIIETLKQKKIIS